MATTYLAPGVYIEEIDRGPKPIQGVGTNVTAFIGFTEKAEEPDPENNLFTQSILGKAQMITNWTQYQRHFGGMYEDAYLPYAVRGFFENGGVRCYVISIHARNALPGQVLVLGKNLRDPKKEGEPSLLIHTKKNVPADAEVKVNISLNAPKKKPAPTKSKTETPAAETKEGQATKVDPAPEEPNNPDDGQYDFWVTYTIKSKSANRFDKRIEEPIGVNLDKLPLYGGIDLASNHQLFDDLKVWCMTKPSQPTVERLPVEGEYTLRSGDTRIYLDVLPDAEQQLLRTKSDDETAIQIFKDNSAKLFRGDVPARKAIGALEALDDVNLLCAPDLMLAHQRKWISDKGLIDIQKAMLDHCKQTSYRFAILDAPYNKKSPKDVYDWRMETEQANFDSEHGALYYPWLQIMDPVTNKTMYIPPCGHMAGIYARSDTERGVHKAPANETVSFAIGVELNVTKGEQELLNPVGINCIRAFPGRGVRVWGARTLSSDPAWRYINVRRLFNYVEESIERNTQWIVFEPNDAFLWARVRRDISSFLRTVWLTGALFGASPQEAFYVKCDAETNPREIRDLGQMICEIGMAPVKPAEFVIFRFTQWAGPSAEE
ncbi:MAG: phage tail sheath subtilisin-like domain-containing protein [Caldilineaceae bacterium]